MHQSWSSETIGLWDALAFRPSVLYLWTRLLGIRFCDFKYWVIMYWVIIFGKKRGVEVDMLSGENLEKMKCVAFAKWPVLPSSWILHFSSTKQEMWADALFEHHSQRLIREMLLEWWKRSRRWKLLSKEVCELHQFSGKPRRKWYEHF